MKAMETVARLEREAKSNATATEAGEACEDGICVRYYPRSNTWAWFEILGRTSKANVVRYFCARERLRRSP